MTEREYQVYEKILQTKLKLFLARWSPPLNDSECLIAVDAFQAGLRAGQEIERKLAKDLALKNTDGIPKGQKR